MARREGSGVMADAATTSFGDLLRHHRLAAGLTQGELAERAGLSVRGINDLERGVRLHPRKDTVALLADALALTGEDRAAFAAAARGHADRTGEQASAPGVPSGFAAQSPLDQPRHNLPIQPTPLLGRAREVEELGTLLRRDGVRLVTLTGPGGIGKTRLALAVAAELVDTLPDGVWFVGLSRLSDPDLVLPTIAETLGVRAPGGQASAELLRAHLRTRRLLLVLDNCEQVAAAAPALADLLRTCPNVRVLATSRVALHLEGEREYPLAPLALPADSGSQGATFRVEQLLEAPAVALFVERARGHRPDFELTNASGPAVAAICARLDGLPLAIGLAAARVKVLPPPQLLARMEQRLPILAGGPRDVEARQQTMRNTLAWSEDLLGPAEQRLFRRLAVFVGGWTLEAAEAVCAATEGVEPLGLDVLEGLERLVDHSLVQPSEVEGTARFRMLYVVREYALERLEASGEAEALRRAHAAYYVAFAERIGPELRGSGMTEWLRRLDPEVDNFRAMLNWAADHQEGELVTRLIFSLAHWWRRRALMPDVATLGKLAIQMKAGLHTLNVNPDGTGPTAPIHPEDVTTAQAMLMRAIVISFDTDWREISPETRSALLARSPTVAHLPIVSAFVQGEESLAILRAAGNVPLLLLALPVYGLMLFALGDERGSSAALEEALTLSRQTGDRLHESRVLQAMEELAFTQGDYARAAELHAASMPLIEQTGDASARVMTLLREAQLLWARGDTASALARARAGLEQARQISYFFGLAEGLEALGVVLGDLGQAERAARALGAAESLHATMAAGIGRSARPTRLLLLERAIANLRATLGDDAYMSAFAAGRALPLDDAIAEALNRDGESGHDGEQEGLL
jgi:predicted ATPase/transcriptional regulator with XRE-family HTH domain